MPKDTLSIAKPDKTLLNSCAIFANDLHGLVTCGIIPSGRDLSVRIFRYETVEADEGRTVKSILRGTLGLSATLIKRLKYHQGIFLDGESVFVDRRVQAGQWVEARLHDEDKVQEMREPVCRPVDVRYEDEDLLIVSKTAPLPSIMSAKQQGDTLEGRMYHYFRDVPDYVYRPVNRLDKGTSGLMVIAKNGFAQQKLQKDLHSEHFVRKYQAVVEGRLPACEGVIDLPIALETPWGVKRVICEDGKKAVTHYRVLVEGNGRSVVELCLETGRTHQIRVHMAALGCPIVGDYIYGNDADELPGRFALHSCYVSIRHPVTGACLVCEAPFPDELKKLV